MSRKANPTLIGAFVLGGIVLVVAALMLFGGGRFFTEKATFVAYFDEPVSGLSIGAPVNFRGVKVGTVKEVLIHYNQAEGDAFMPVIIEVAAARSVQPPFY